MQVEKIKTIGDSFMCAKLSTSELREVDEVTRKKTIAQDGLAMVQFLFRAMALANGVVRPAPDADPDDDEEAGCEFLELRIGMHVGAIASGIVGFERPLYDLFGDTVNTAARLEASGRSRCVHVMESALPMFGDDLVQLELEPTVHTLELKGLGTTTTRMITSVGRPRLSHQSRRSSAWSDLADVERKSQGAIYRVHPAQDSPGVYDV